MEYRSFMKTVIDRLRRLRGLVDHSGKPAQRLSTNYKLLEDMPVGLDGWRTDEAAQRQHDAFVRLVGDVYQGHPRLDFVVAAQAIETTGMETCTLIEVGCGSGYYSKVLPLLARCAINYVGLDYSLNMVQLGYRSYPNTLFVNGDAAYLPFPAGCFDIVFSGTSLMHIPRYATSITEAVRVSRQWCIFHTVPVMIHAKTTILSKHAYGQPVVEVIFNKQQLESLFHDSGLVVRQQFESIPYDVSAVLGENSWTITYLCEKH